MATTLAVVGTGPTGIYAFRSLIRHSTPLVIWLFEKGEKAGIGMPYSPETASKAMLANIASIEIPPVVTPYLDWLQDLPQARLSSYGLAVDELDDRQFTPRLLLGEYFRDQLMTLVDHARAAGHQIEIREKTEITDLVAQEGKVILHSANGPLTQRFDRVIVATGHVFPEAEEASRTYFPSPWSGLIDAEIPAARVGIMGTSLSSIDAAMAVANQHGRFHRKGEDLTFKTDGEGLKITLMSWTGVLPEADFYCPLPYLPLQEMTDAALARCLSAPRPYDAIFDLFRAEILQADPAYAARIGLADLTADSFPDAYFAEREAQDPFRWARKNLVEVEYNKAHEITVPWRYAILRMHEKIDAVVADLPEDDRERFDTGLKKVFVDNYAAVPSESIRRLLALRDAGVLEVLALGDRYDLDRTGEKTVIRAKGKTHVFDIFIDARGQKPLTTEDLPFPHLRDALLEAGQEIPEVDDAYQLIGAEDFAGRISFGALPYLMHDKPFVQGITACAEIGTAMAREIRQDAARRKRRRWA